MVGVMPTREALKLAQAAELDLVEVSPNADPPVCRIMDFGKFRYDESVKRKESRKQSRTHSRALKEVKFHANVGEHDYQTKVNHARAFLEKGHKVKISLQFRGRENRKIQYALLTSASVRAGLEPDLLDEVIWWHADDYWRYALYAAVALIREGADRQAIPVAQLVEQLAGRHGIALV